MKPYLGTTTFTTVIDSDNRLANHFGFKIVPNGLFIDKNGVIRLIKQGFRVNDEQHNQAVIDLIVGNKDKVELEDQYFTSNINVSDMDSKLASKKYKLGMEYAKNGEKDSLLEELEEALQLDPNNFLIRKQLWYIRFPEKFSPTIDTDWQQEQLKKEKEEEAKQKR